MSKRARLLWSWSGVSLAGIVLIGIVIAISRERIDPSTPAEGGAIEGLTETLAREVSNAEVALRFADATEAMGIHWRHFPDRRTSMLPEDMGSGAAWGDYDGDGDPDLFLVNFAGNLENTASEATHALYRNDGDRFTDVTEAAGLAIPSRGLGAAWADYDDDGDLDLYVTNFGPNLFFVNDGQGRFDERAAAAGIDDPSFSAGASWADYDRDGRVDLYVSNYVEFVVDELQTGEVLQYGAETPFTLNPSAFASAPNRLFHNNGDGSFSEVAQEAGVANSKGRSLAAAWFDFNNDGWPDLYVANDVSDNGVYLNLGDGRFEDIGAASLAADYRGAMGLAVADYDNDRDIDMFVTHWLAQENAFFENMYAQDWRDDKGQRRLFFMDSAELLGLGHISLQTVGWATSFADLDNDGLLDLWVVNGDTLESSADNRLLRPQPMHLYHQRPEQGFFEQAAQSCPCLTKPFVGRGGAQADFDGDGRMDILVMRHGERPLLLHNRADSENAHWIALRLRQSGGNAEALGASVLLTVGDKTQYAYLASGASYLSQNSRDLHFGLGRRDHVDEVVIRWPDGQESRTGRLQGDRVHVIEHRARY